jgi:hypothetical protein
MIPAVRAQRKTIPDLSTKDKKEELLQELDQLYGVNGNAFEDEDEAEFAEETSDLLGEAKDEMRSCAEF